jgi:DNA-binding transcriptional LysR family regulator
MMPMSNQLEFRHYAYFLEVARCLHFRKAAERLFISQPGLSRQIKQMEDVLEVQLFVRNNRNVALTEAGEFLFRALEENFKQLDEVLHHAKLVNDGMAGKLKIGYVGSAIQNEIPKLLLKFQPGNPKVVVHLTEMDNKSQIEAILKNDLDLGFVRVDRLPKNIEFFQGEEETFSLVLPENHILNEDSFQDLSQLKDENFILFNAIYSESYYEKVMQIFDDCRFHPNVSHSTVNASSIYKLVENNFGVSIVPTSLKHGYNMKIKFIELKNIRQRTALKIIWNKNNTNPVLTILKNLILG